MIKFHIIVVLSNSLLASKHMEDLYGNDAWKFDYFQEESNAKDILKALNQLTPTCFLFFHQENHEDNVITPRQVMYASLRSWGLMVKDVHISSFSKLIDTVTFSIVNSIKTEIL